MWPHLSALSAGIRKSASTRPMSKSVASAEALSSSKPMLPSSRRVSIRLGAAASIRLTAIAPSSSIAEVLSPISTSGSSLSSRPSAVAHPHAGRRELEQLIAPQAQLTCLRAATTTRSPLSCRSM